MAGGTHLRLIAGLHAPTWPPRLVAIVTLVAFALVILGPVLARPAFGGIDDHQLFLIHQRSGAEGWLPVLESYIAESGARFRPLYWIGQFSEMGMWGLSPAGWYVDRLLLIVGSLLLGVWAFRPFAPLLPATIGALVAFAGPQAEPWYRLGPQEAYAVPLTLAALGLVARGRYSTGIALAVLAALTKEVFVVSSFAIVAFAWHRGHRSLAGVGALLAIGAVIGLLALTRPDAYVESRFGAMLAEPRYWWPWAIGVGLAVSMVLARLSRPWVLVAVAVILLGGTSAFLSARGWADYTNRWMETVARIHAPFIVVADGPQDFEAVVALRRFVPDGEASLVLRPALPTTPLETDLWAQMQEWAQGGAGYAPGVTGDCVAAVFTPGAAPCPTVVVVPR